MHTACHTQPSDIAECKPHVPQNKSPKPNIYYGAKGCLKYKAEFEAPWWRHIIMHADTAMAGTEIFFLGWSCHVTPGEQSRLTGGELTNCVLGPSQPLTLLTAFTSPGRLARWA